MHQSTIKDQLDLVSENTPRLIEYDLPIGRLSALKGKRTTAHDVDVRSAGIWWTRKPQHQCRAIWLATLMPDPDCSSINGNVRKKLQELLRKFGFLRTKDQDNSLRESLLGVCEFFANPSSLEDESSVQFLVELGGLFSFGDIVALDPFSGSGAIPIEATRLGLSVLAGEYNPMACLNLRFLLEDWAKVSESDAEEFSDVLCTLITSTIEHVSQYHVAHSEFGLPYGYIRFRTLTCQGPGCGMIVPATSKFLLDARNKIGISM